MSITKTIENGHTSWHPNIRFVRDHQAGLKSKTLKKILWKPYNKKKSHSKSPCIAVVTFRCIFLKILGI